MVSGAAGDLAHVSISLANMAVNAAASAGRGFDGCWCSEQPYKTRLASSAMMSKITVAAAIAVISAWS